MTTLEVRASVLRDIASLFGNDSAMLRLQGYVRSLKREVALDKKACAKTYTHEELREDLREALQELKDVREGKIQPQTMQDLYMELEAIE